MVTLQSFPALRLAKLRELLDLIAALRQIDWPVDSADDLKAAIALLVRLSDLLGIDSQWTARLKSILEDPKVFEIVLAIVRFLSSQIATHGAARVLEIEPKSLAAWLPIVLQILELLRVFADSRLSRFHPLTSHF
jgi:hypothetical protein